MKKALPICVASLSEVSDVIVKYRNDFDLFEVWLDYLDSYPAEELLRLADEGISLLLLFRRRNLDDIQMPIAKRKQLIDEVQSQKIAWDFDVTVQEEELQYYREKERVSSLWCSYHHYESTPSEKELEEILQKMMNYKPSLIKFACFCETKRDALRLLEFLLVLREAGHEAIVLGMGEYGIITRVLGSEYGNAVMFLSAGDDAESRTAQGQLSLEDFRNLEQSMEKIVRRITNGRK